MKKSSFLILLILLVISSSANIYAEQTNIIIKINGQDINFNNVSGYPFLDKNSRIQVPFRIALEEYGAKVDWIQSTRTAIAIKDDIRVKVPIGYKHIIVNDENIANDTAAMIVDSKTYLPIRKVMEAFGLEVSWDNEKQIVNIFKPKLEESDKDLQEMINKLEGKVIFDNDISIFTLFAFMNFTGYEEENNPNGFHNVREKVITDLNNMNLKLKDNDYYKNKNVAGHYYRHLLTRIDGAPNFKVTQRLPDYLSQLSDLGIHLKEFYEKANIEELFKQYDSYYQEELEKYSKPIYPALAKTNQFLRVGNDEITEFYFQVNLLDAYWRGSGLGNTFQHKGGKGIIITGPSDEPNLKNVVHEYLHGIITPINNELRNEIEDISFLIKNVPKDTQATDSSYNNWFAIFDESLIRALDSRYLEDDLNHIQNEMNHGFILTGFFHERFDEFESYEGTLKKFIRMLIEDIKTENK